MIRKLALLVLVSASGCIRPPDVVIIDRKTALEQLAAGTYRGLEDELERAATQPRAEPLTRAEIESAKEDTTPEKEQAELHEAALLDELLRRRCVGESLEGTILVTASSCQGKVDAAERSRVVERTNRDRFQIWRELQSRGMPKGKERDLAPVRHAWREAHLRAVVCGGQVQRADGSWEDKKC